MGIGPSAIRLIAELGAAGHIRRGAAIVEIGAQHLSDGTLGDGDKLIATLKSAFRIPGEIALRLPPAGSRVKTASGHAVQHLAEPLWTALGFQYSSIDLDGSPGSIPLDLNFDEVGEAFRGRFGLTTNYGTTEHLINQFNAMKVIHDLTAKGGVMIHNLPAHGYINHGYFRYNPRFFFGLAQANKYDVLHVDLRIDRHAQELDAGLVTAIARFDTTIRTRAETYRISDGGVVVALKKTTDAAFLPPLDVPDWTDVANAPWAERYADPVRPRRGLFRRLRSRFFR